MRKAAHLLWLLGALILLSACAKKSTPPASGQAPTGEKRLRAAMVTDIAGIGDRSFNESAWRGLQRAEKELGAEVRYLESAKLPDYERNLRLLAQQGYNVVVAVGFAMEDALKKVAPQFPNVVFAIVDGNAPDLPNCVSLKFREHEGSFLVGALAGAMTKTGTVGFVGGMEIPLIKKFEAGYRAGVMTTNPQAKVLVGYTGNWTDTAKGKELALSQFERGADIVYHASGQCGLGVIEAAKERGKGHFAIGVDSDQDYIAPGFVLTSMIKGVDNAVFEVCKSVKEGTFQPGTRDLGIKENGVGLSPMQYTKHLVPQQVLDKIETLRQMIADGRLKVPQSEEELKGFQPPVLP
ncbi:MAG: BMP family ABC transporter substrate-binding protein [Armatimonadota bacterium]|nr:BMP family ABC transporter substrate-binding protein [Armatimonadota bacterium]